MWRFRLLKPRQFTFGLEELNNVSHLLAFVLHLVGRLGRVQKVRNRRADRVANHRPSVHVVHPKGLGIGGQTHHRIGTEGGCFLLGKLNVAHGFEFMCLTLHLPRLVTRIPFGHGCITRNPPSASGPH